MVSIKELHEDCDVIIHCASGHKYSGSYVKKFECVFMAIPAEEKIIGYEVV